MTAKKGKVLSSSELFELAQVTAAAEAAAAENTAIINAKAARSPSL